MTPSLPGAKFAGFVVVQAGTVIAQRLNMPALTSADAPVVGGGREPDWL